MSRSCLPPCEAQTTKYSQLMYLWGKVYCDSKINHWPPGILWQYIFKSCQGHILHTLRPRTFKLDQLMHVGGRGLRPKRTYPETFVLNDELTQNTACFVNSLHETVGLACKLYEQSAWNGRHGSLVSLVNNCFVSFLGCIIKSKKVS